MASVTFYEDDLTFEADIQARSLRCQKIVELERRETARASVERFFCTVFGSVVGRTKITT